MRLRLRLRNRDWESETDTGTETETEKQRLRERQTLRLRQRLRNRLRDRDRHWDWESEPDTETETETEKQGLRDRDRHWDWDWDWDRARHWEWDRDWETETERQTVRARQKASIWGTFCVGSATCTWWLTSRCECRSENSPTHSSVASSPSSVQTGWTCSQRPNCRNLFRATPPTSTSKTCGISVSVLTAISPGEPGLASFIGAKDDRSSDDSWSYKTCKAPVKSSPSTNQHPAFYRPDALPGM